MTDIVPATPMVTAILIFLNGEAFIAEAIESIIAQTFTDWELILVDDGSTDGATQIAKRFAERYPDRIRYIDHPGHANCGMSASRNAGIHAARGDILAFLDADDIWLPRRLEAHVAILARQPDVAVVMAPTLWWRSWMGAARSTLKPWLTTDTVGEIGLPLHQSIPPPEVALSYLVRRGATLPGICSVTVRRAAALAVGGFNPDFRTLYEDQVFHFRIGLRFPIWVDDEVLARYRQHDESACNKEGRVASDIRMRPVFLAWLERHLSEIGCKDHRLWNALRAEMLRFERPTYWAITRFPIRVRDWWNVNSRLLWILLFTPTGYNRLRRLFGLSHVTPA
jgi:glycosyltransferase involved in cell wall biosynthesis